MADEPAQPRTSRLLDSVMRSVTPASRLHARSTSQTMHMYSTPQESAPSSPSASFRDPPPSTARPTIEQIAMGLHVSRTPHLRHSPRSPHSQPITPTISRRSSRSLKNSKNSASSTAVSESSCTPLSAATCASASTSTIASAPASLHLVPPATDKHVSSASTILAIKQQMARLIPGEKRRSMSAPQLDIPADGAQKRIPPPQKAVRFELLSN
ncbi:hypothetical protein Agabi119p4_6372 [Agaricus bisporus var. burnettii]|uniref:Uncharacterized protein n=1 Tax=Agaricus bisporus var. burnettii TaxID=192524 RepID=A0A8H7C9V6_AGABI|nr:hypothetical protein Agabi119p4_6372 [Agaricus bisporus var. burnettii]